MSPLNPYARAWYPTGASSGSAVAAAQSFAERARALYAAAQLASLAGSGPPPGFIIPASPPLHQAARRGDLEAIAAILAAGDADIDGRDEDGWTALHEASESGHVTIVEAFLRAGAAVDPLCSFGSSPLHAAAFGKAGEASLVVVKVLLAAGASVNLQNQEGRAPLHHAATRGRADIAQALLDAGADKDLKNAAGSSPLMCACRFGRKEVMQALLAVGAV